MKNPMGKKKRGAPKQFIVPMKLTYYGQVVVIAEDAEHARELADDGKFEDPQTTELLDYESRGAGIEASS